MRVMVDSCLIFVKCRKVLCSSSTHSLVSFATQPRGFARGYFQSSFLFAFKEGKQASLAADFSLTQFSHIGRLLIWHGRNR